ncbi:MAG: cytochrome bd-I oxidase subunit CydX [Caulobacteraceae bacterium]
MWYFSWILGLSLAASFSILNALWLEISPERIASRQPPRAPSP